jgi:hypothetical protein
LFQRVGFSTNQIPSFDQFLSAAEEGNKTLLKHFARKGGKAPKRDALQELIDEIVGQNPAITEPQLLEKLTGRAGAGVITLIDKPCDRMLECDPLFIHYIDNNGRPKIASLKGLKDRLSRTKKRIRNSH